jgi:hypothetical protein
LTLNLGLRYNLCTLPLEVHNCQSNFNLSALTLQQAGTHGLSANVVQTNRNNFVPRFACDLPGDGKTSVRGGYGIFHFLDRGGVGNQLSENPDFNGTASCSDLPSQGGYRLDFAGAAPACPTLTGCNEALPASQGTLPLPVFGAMVHRWDPINSGLISIDTYRPTSRIQQWNLQVQRQLPLQTWIDVACVGTSSQHLSNWLIVNSQELNTAPDTTMYKDGNDVAFNLSNALAYTNPAPIMTDGKFGKITSVRLPGTPTAALTALDVLTHLQPSVRRLSAAVQQSSLFISSRVCARSQKSA